MGAQRPTLSNECLDRIVQSLGVDRSIFRLVVVGVRGFFSGPAGNARNVYDDALFIVTSSLQGRPSSSPYHGFNANTDPSKFKPGEACLIPGVYYAYKFDRHKGEYLALCQRTAPVSVLRDGNPPRKDVGMFGINIHRGCYNSTGSEGCQTVHPDQWTEFIGLAVNVARGTYGSQWDRIVVPYVLINREDIPA